MRKFLKNAGVNVFTFVSTRYIEFVYRTSRIIRSGDHSFYKRGGDPAEQYVISFWHGETYCYYPLLRDDNIVIITTSTPRGAYISKISEYFGYEPIRVPDESSDGGGTFSVKNVINKVKGRHVAITLDGPSGPYHEPKRFALVTSLVSGKKILLISVVVKRKIQLKKRWDKFVIPLPFNKIEFFFHEPFAVKKDSLAECADMIVKTMEQPITFDA